MALSYCLAGRLRMGAGGGTGSSRPHLARMLVAAITATSEQNLTGCVGLTEPDLDPLEDGPVPSEQASVGG